MLKSQATCDFDWQQLNQLAGEDADFEAELLAIFLQEIGRASCRERV